MRNCLPLHKTKTNSQKPRCSDPEGQDEAAPGLAPANTECDLPGCAGLFSWKQNMFYCGLEANVWKIKAEKESDRFSWRTQ